MQPGWSGNSNLAEWCGNKLGNLVLRCLKSCLLGTKRAKKNKNNKSVPSTWIGKGTRARMNPLPAAVRISPLIFLSPSTEHKALSPVPISGGPRELTFDCEILCSWITSSPYRNNIKFSVNLWIIYVGRAEACDKQCEIQESRKSYRTWGALRLEKKIPFVTACVDCLI